MRKNRREFLCLSGRAMGALALGSCVRQFGLLESAVASAAADDYKALVCIFLFGGNDGNNMVIPYDGYSGYASVRGSLAISQASLLQISPPSVGARLGLHPALTDLHTLWGQGKLAVLGNAGPLVEPITRAQYQSGAPRPENLFSHSDQQAQFQSAATTSSSTTTIQTGWGGRIADVTGSLNGAATFPMLVSVSGVPLFSTGLSSRPFVPGTSLQGFDSSGTSTARYNALREILTLDRAAVLVKAASDITSSAIDNVNTLNQALATLPPLSTVFPSTSLGNQLKQVANIIAVRGALGVKRQIFFASIGGFDTHNGQLATQQSLLTQLSQAMKALYDATVELGVANSVTTFTLTDFGRTFKPASGGGTDHAWGNHQLIAGGSVLGGELYGKFPTLALAGPDDTGSEGRWIPTTSVDQYAATLALWFGLPAGNLRTVFPNLGRFSPETLGFLG